MKLYVLEMVRVTFVHDPHRYVEGIYNTKQKAEAVGLIEEIWRAGKYRPEVTAFEVDPPIDKEKFEWALECSINEEERNQIRSSNDLL